MPKSIKKQFTLSSSISSINWASKKKENKRKQHIKTENQGKVSHKNQEVEKHEIKTARFKNLNLDPYTLPLLKNRVLSPTTRAKRVLGYTPKKRKRQKYELDSSIERSLEKIDNENEENFPFDNKFDKPLYSK